MDSFSWTLNWSQTRPRFQGDGVVGCITDSSHGHIQCFWLAEVQNFINIMIECVITSIKIIDCWPFTNGLAQHMEKLNEIHSLGAMMPLYGITSRSNSVSRQQIELHNTEKCLKLLCFWHIRRYCNISKSSSVSKNWKSVMLHPWV